MYNASDLRKGLKIELDGEPYAITEFDFRKPGKGQSIYRCKLRHMINGTGMEKSFRTADKIGKPDLMERDMIYSYDDGMSYVFMDPTTYDQTHVAPETIGDLKYFLKEDIECQVLFYDDKPIEVTLPNFIEAEITETEPGARGDTATNVTKPAKIENGYEIAVPLFVNLGDIVKIDTRTGQYSERVKKA